MRALAAIATAGAILRFATLDAQSFWLDEAATVDLVRRGFGDMLDGVADGESTPPLYYVLAWLWAKVAGTGEVGLRALSALAGTATILVAWALGNRVAGRRAGLIAAALCAANPFLIWYSQEARAYALLVLLTAAGVLVFLALRERVTAGRLVAWALLSAAALATHWFALFPVAVEAGWLLWRERRRAAPAVAGVAAVGAALLPLALDQRSHDRAGFIDESALVRRLAEVPKQFLTGYDAPVEAVLTALALVLAAVAAVAALRADVRPRVAAVAAIGLAAVAVPALLAVAGADYLIARNVLPALVPLLAVGAAGLAALRAGPVVAAVLAVLGAGAAVAVAAEPGYQRDDWRGAARALGPAERDRAIIVTPASGLLPLSIYLDRSRAVTAPGVKVREIGMIGLAAHLPGAAGEPPRPTDLQPPAPGFTQASRTDGETFTTVVFESPLPFNVTPTVGASPLDSRPARTLFQPTRGQTP